MIFFLIDPIDVFSEWLDEATDRQVIESKNYEQEYDEWRSTIL